MEQLDAFNQRHPFMFKIEDIKDHVDGLLKENLFESALDDIKVIREKYIRARNLNQIPKGESFVYGHFHEYWKEQMDLAMNGKTYPDGSKDKVIFELKNLERWIESLKIPKVKKRTVPFVALYLYYSGEEVNTGNVNQIAKKHGFKNGLKLTQEYNKFRSSADRTADPDSKTKLKNKIKLFEAIIKELDISKRGKIEDELKILKEHLLIY
jgi:hypothetical protein